MVARSARHGAGIGNIPHVARLLGYLFVAIGVAVTIAVSRRVHGRRSRSPLWGGFTLTAASALFLVSGLMGFNLDQRVRFASGSAWSDGPIFWQLVVGLVLVPFAVHFLRRGIRDLKQQSNAARRPMRGSESGEAPRF